MVFEIIPECRSASFGTGVQPFGVIERKNWTLRETLLTLMARERPATTIAMAFGGNMGSDVINGILESVFPDEREPALRKPPHASALNVEPLLDTDEAAAIVRQERRGTRYPRGQVVAISCLEIEVGSSGNSQADAEMSRPLPRPNGTLNPAIRCALQEHHVKANTVPASAGKQLSVQFRHCRPKQRHSEQPKRCA
jgi:hypothetical protein